jgi:hypothetical protein
MALDRDFEAYANDPAWKDLAGSVRTIGVAICETVPHQRGETVLARRPSKMPTSGFGFEIASIVQEELARFKRLREGRPE